MVSDLLCIFQDGRWHILAGNIGQPAKVLSTVPEYILAELQEICAEWRSLIENCKRFLSIAVRLPSRLLATVEFSRAKANLISVTESGSAG